jgi:hypothetical protein
VAAIRPSTLISVVKTVFTYSLEHHINVGLSDETGSVQKFGADVCKDAIYFIGWRPELLEVNRGDVPICRWTRYGLVLC